MNRPGWGHAPVGGVHMVVPHSIDDPRHPSGGNVYDRELAWALTVRGVQVHRHRVASTWPRSRPGWDHELAGVLAVVPDRATVLVDGMIGLGAHEVLLVERERLRVLLLAHLPLALAGPDTPAIRAREQRALTAVAGVIATSDWTRRWLITTYGIAARHVWVARPGVHPAPLARGSSSGAALVCVGAVVPAKGHDVLVAALARVRDLTWSCRVVGPLDRDPGFVDRLRGQVRGADLADRIRFTGPLPPGTMGSAYDGSDLLVLPTRLETYGMVVTEALARGIPVVASDAGGVAEALGYGSDGRTPGVLVPPGDARALGAAVRRWLEDAAWRRQLGATARARGLRLAAWSTTARTVHEAIWNSSMNRSGPTNVVRA